MKVDLANICIIIVRDPCTNLKEVLKCDSLEEFIRFLRVRKKGYRQTMNQTQV